MDVNPCGHTQRGQAMVEFVIFCGVVMTALFVIVPLFGKIMDMQFQTQQAARYVAWERTVWFDSGDEPFDSTLDHVAFRNDNLVEHSAVTRFFGNSGRAIEPVVQADVGAVNDTVSPLWTYAGSGASMYESVVVSSQQSSDTPAFFYKYVLDTFNDVMGVIKKPLDIVLAGLGGGNPGFMQIHHQTRTYFNPQVVTRLDTGNAIAGDRSPESWLYAGGWDGRFRARAAILADGWNAQSLDHFKERADDFVPSTLFDNGLINTVKDVASVLDSSLDRLEFGWVGTEPIPESDVHCYMGYCYFDE